MLGSMAPTHRATADPALTRHVPSTMRAAVITRHGGPDVIEVRDVAVPRPGPTDVLVRVSAARDHREPLNAEMSRAQAARPAQ